MTALAAGACSSTSSAPAVSSGSGPELTHITVGALAITDDAPLFIAIKKGYFTQQGLTVTSAVNLTSNIQTLTINAVLRNQGVSTSGIKYVIIPFPDMPSALVTGKVDAISVVEPFITAAEHNGARSVLAQCQGPTAGIPLGGYYATQAWVKKYPRTALAFRRAIDQAQAAADADHALVQQVIPTYTKITPAIAARISLPYYPPALQAAQLERVVALMRSAGMVSGSFSATPLLFHPGG